MEEVDELTVALRHDIGKYIRHRIVYPVEQDARNKTAGAIIHPSQEQAHQKGIDKLRLVAMNRSEDGDLFTMRQGKWIGAKMGFVSERKNTKGNRGWIDAVWFRVTK